MNEGIKNLLKEAMVVISLKDEERFAIQEDCCPVCGCTEHMILKDENGTSSARCAMQNCNREFTIVSLRDRVYNKIKEAIMPEEDTFYAQAREKLKNGRELLPKRGINIERLEELGSLFNMKSSYRDGGYVVFEKDKAVVGRPIFPYDTAESLTLKALAHFYHKRKLEY